MNKPEHTDTWPLVVAVLDKYSMEAWRSGAMAERQRILELLEGYFKPEEAKDIFPANHHQYLDLLSLIEESNK